MRDCLAKSPFSKDYARHSRETASHRIVALQSYRVHVMKCVILNSTATSGLHAPFFSFFFISSGKRRQRSPSETLQRCRRLISWLNIIGRGGRERSLSLSLIPIGPLVLLYDPPQLATELVLQRQLGVPRTIEIPFSTVTDRPLFLETRFLGLRKRHSRP